MNKLFDNWGIILKKEIFATSFHSYQNNPLWGDIEIFGFDANHMCLSNYNQHLPSLWLSKNSFKNFEIFFLEYNKGAIRIWGRLNL